MVSGGQPAAHVDWGSLGLLRGHSRIVAHDDRWPDVYRSVQPSLRAALAHLNPKIEHIGSTAVPGLPAKPILDIAICLPHAFDIADVVARLADVGVEFTGDAGTAGGLVFAATTAPDLVVLHVHVVAESDVQWSRYLAFRDALRDRSQLAAAYTDLKRSLAAAHPTDRVAYTDGKSAWVEDALRLIAHEPVRVD